LGGYTNGGKRKRPELKVGLKFEPCTPNWGAKDTFQFIIVTLQRGRGGNQMPKKKRGEKGRRGRGERKEDKRKLKTTTKGNRRREAIESRPNSSSELRKKGGEKARANSRMKINVCSKKKKHGTE